MNLYIRVIFFAYKYILKQLTGTVPTAVKILDDATCRFTGVIRHYDLHPVSCTLDQGVHIYLCSTWIIVRCRPIKCFCWWKLIIDQYYLWNLWLAPSILHPRPRGACRCVSYLDNCTLSSNQVFLLIKINKRVMLFIQLKCTPCGVNFRPRGACRCVSYWDNCPLSSNQVFLLKYDK